MAAQGRKNVHGKAGVRFRTGYTPSKNKAMLRDVVSALIVHGEVKVTSGVTKDLVSLADHMVTLGKENTLASRREAAKVLRPGIVDEKSVNALKKLFSEVAPRFSTRKGGYTQVYKLGKRKGDNAEVTLVKFVD